MRTEATLRDRFDRWWEQRSRPVVSAAPLKPEHPVIAALRRAGRPLTNTELAAVIGCSQGQATKLRRQVREHLIEMRSGKYVFVMLADFQSFQRFPIGQGRGK